VCGIVGQARADGGPVDIGLLERMCEALAHRGPDSRGTHRSAGAGLGIQRLRVIDLQTGDQPIHNEDRTVAVVLNGEIYNYAELRRRLERAGHRFATNGDTEVIVHLYEDEGPDCVRHLHGMFAFAVWDSRRRRLMLARDRVGKKPLFYAERNGALTFGSELRALLQDERIPRDIDHRALDSYLTYLYVPAPLSAFRAVRKLPPATTLTYENGQVSLRRYWSLDFAAKRDPRSMEELHEEIRESIRAAVKRRLVADVPVGALLSGGIDSSAVVAAMAQEAHGRVKTFSVGFDNETFNELPAARKVAAWCDTEHHEFTVRPDAIELLPQIVRHYGEPFADHSAIPSFQIAALTRQHVTVALNGDGGDESFAGYYSYVRNLRTAHFDGLPLALRRAAAALGARLPANGDVRSAFNRARRFSRALPLDPVERFVANQTYMNPLERAWLYTDDYADVLSHSEPERVLTDAWHAASGEALLDVMQEVDIGTWLAGDLIPKMDIATMAHALEARSPFLDHELMQLAASIPADLKLPSMRKKGLLRDALKPWLPADILERPKQGFCVPMADWLRGDLRDFAADTLLDRAARSRGYFREASVRSLLTDHANGRGDHSNRIWALLVHELWHREFVDRANADVRPPSRVAA
jgi:asparagine synthase (glutamine-hydrolysing)